MHNITKVIDFKILGGYGDDWYTLSSNGKIYKIHAAVGQLCSPIAGPTHTCYLELDENNKQKRIVWSNYYINMPYSPNQGVRVDVVASTIGDMAITAKIIEGFEVSKIGDFIPVFVNEKKEKEAIVYPYIDLNWEILQSDYASCHAKNMFTERVLPELQKYGFVQNENGRWILPNE